MCGIAGILDFNAQTPEESKLNRMVRALAHRGPDGEGSLIRPSIAIGHKRLSIIDPAGGKQPLANEDESVWITFNGEIYNYRELRTELLQAGHTFRTQSDTEVIVHAYEQWGPACVTRLRGMFAFGLVDFRQRRLFLARDHFGIKPLYIRRTSKQLLFASELPALLAGDDSLPPGRLSALDHYLHYRFIPLPETIYEGIEELPPAHSCVIEFGGQTNGPQRYWQWEFDIDDSRSEAECLEQFQIVLRESVQAHLVSDVPFGVFLSGGIDSTLIAMQMAELLPPRTPAFAIGFDDNVFSELPFARQVAERLNLDLHTQTLTAADIGHFCELVQSFGEPFSDTSAIPAWCVARLARQSVPMVLSGDGGDEFFGGYGRYDDWMWAAVRPQKPQAADRIRVMVQTATLPVKERFTSPERRLREWQPHLGGLIELERTALWRPEYRGQQSVAAPGFLAAARNARRDDRLSFAQSMDLQTYLPGDVLKKVDVTSMAHGLEVRTPLIDLRVAEFARRLPAALRRWSNRWGGSLLKVLPKRALEQQYDKAFVHREKRGFCVPEQTWLKPGSPVRVLCDDVLRNSQARVFDYLDYAALQQQLSRMEQSERSAMIVWTILILALWLEGNPRVTFASQN